MRTKPRKPHSDQSDELLQRLLEARGLVPGDYALFFVTGEGRYFAAGPSGEQTEELSGCAVDRAGRIFSFWLGWDPETQSADLIEWERVSEPDPVWLQEAEYRHAREQVGLA